MTETFERIVRFDPAFDKRDPDPPKNYGVHGVNALFVLKGAKGAVQFLLFTDWHLPHVAAELKAKSASIGPLPADLGYHSPVPMWEGQAPISDTCEWLDDQPCYYGGSGLAADGAYKALVEQGSGGIWAHLEAYYKSTFGDSDQLTNCLAARRKHERDAGVGSEE